MITANSKLRNNFHLLRHIAAFLVIYAHCTPFGYTEFFNQLTNGKVELGSLGVETFFIISGYLVTQSLMNNASRWHFLQNRLLRLWPALIVVTLLLTVFVGPLVSSLPAINYFQHPQTWRFLFRNILFLPVYQLPAFPTGNEYAGNANFWTLFFEAACYFLLLLVGQKALLKYKLTIIAIWFISFFLKYFAPTLLPWPAILGQYKVGIGTMMFLFFTASVWRIFEPAFTQHPKPLYITSAAIFLLVTILPFPISLVKPLQDLSLVIFVIQWGKSKPLVHWPSWDISYGTYLVGGIVETLLLRYGGAIAASHIFLLGSTLAITLPTAFASWYFIERPALRKKYHQPVAPPPLLP